MGICMVSLYVQGMLGICCLINMESRRRGRPCFFFYQIGQFIMCHWPLWAKFNEEYGFRQSQRVHMGCSSRLRPHGFLLGW